MEDIRSIDWSETIGKEARGARDDGDFGEVHEIGRNYVMTKRGLLEKDKFFIPKRLVYGFDGHTLWFEATEKEGERFKRDSAPQDIEYDRDALGPDRVPRVEGKPGSS